MIRGTTAQFKFKLPYSYCELEWITIKFWQPGNPSERLPITKTKTNCSTTDDPTELCVSLSATETAIFSDKYKGKVQLRAQPFANGSFGSTQQTFTVYPMHDGIIDEDIPEEPDTPPVAREEWIVLDGGTVG